MLAWISYSCLMPPNLFILAGAIGVAVAWRHRRVGLWLVTAAIGCLYVVSTPVAAHFLIRSAEVLAQDIPRLPADGGPRAIIVLAGDYRHSNVAGYPDTVGPLTLERLAEAARQQRRLSLPVLVSGGRVGESDDSLAAMMSNVLQNDFRVPVQWREDHSANTFENALFSAEILRHAGISAAFLVTNPWHMARALWAFWAIGYPAVPSPTHEERSLLISGGAFLPQIPALEDSYYALHELVGLAWYRVRYGVLGNAVRPSTSGTSRLLDSG